MKATSSWPILPGQTLGLLGGGQLGRMFCMAAQSLGYTVIVLDPAPSCPAGDVANSHLVADYLDPQALTMLTQQCQAITTEFENVPATALQFLSRHCVVSPAGDAVAIAQNRRREKAFIQRTGLSVAPYAVIDNEADLATVSDDLFPGILKASQLGYDGKGQARVANAAALRDAWEHLQRVPCVLEQQLPLAQEISVLIARTMDGAHALYPIAENTHRHGILDTSVVPANISTALTEQACQAALALAQGLEYVGVLCVEFFVLQDGSLVVNELAPRPHNSGHYSIDACITSQFEQQVRALTGLPLGSTQQHRPAIMLNLLGDLWFTDAGERDPPWAGVLALPTAKLHLYGKTNPHVGRKMGHITFVGALADIERDVARARELLERS